MSVLVVTHEDKPETVTYFRFMKIVKKLLHFLSLSLVVAGTVFGANILNIRILRHIHAFWNLEDLKTMMRQGKKRR